MHHPGLSGSKDIRNKSTSKEGKHCRRKKTYFSLWFRDKWSIPLILDGVVKAPKSYKGIFKMVVKLLHIDIKEDYF